MKILIQLLVKVEIKNRSKWQAANEHLFKLMPSPVLHKWLAVSSIKDIHHMSFVTPYRVWVRDGKKKLILKDTTTHDMLQYIVSLVRVQRSGSHTVNSRGDLIPKRICTDPLLNILVWDDNNVLVISKDGQFLMYHLNGKWY